MVKKMAQGTKSTAVHTWSHSVKYLDDRQKEEKPSLWLAAGWLGISPR